MAKWRELTKLTPCTNYVEIYGQNSAVIYGAVKFYGKAPERIMLTS